MATDLSTRRDRDALVGLDDDRDALIEAFTAVRRQTLHLVHPLAPEDMVPQAMPDASPTKWHLAHTSWFFEALVLRRAEPSPDWFEPAYAYLFNSYYNSLGEQYPRPHRGLITRPTVAEVLRYREHVDEQVVKLAGRIGEKELERTIPIVRLGLHHEQQHQELVVTDIKALLARNPMAPVYRQRPAGPTRHGVPPITWRSFAEDVYPIGHRGPSFAYDNEGPPHRALVPAFQLADRLVTCGEYLEFMADGGYERPELWLSEGWATIHDEGWRAPLYWEKRDGEWHLFTLAGRRRVDTAEAMCHVSLFEADAFARWAGARLPTEQEWEAAAAAEPMTGNFVEDERFHPTAAPPGNGLRQLFGDLWEWTSSAYAPYPGYKPAAGAVGEYNGKFMCNQYVLRGGSCATPAAHIRASYRNFWPARTRFQFSGIRLARDGE